MGSLIEDTFRKISDQKYVVVHRQIAFAIMWGIGFCIVLFGCFDSVIKLSKEFSFSLSYIIVYGIFFIIGGGMMLLFVVMGLMTTTTEIDFSTRKARIICRNIRGVYAISEASLDNLCISAVRMGRVTAASRGSWIVRAGFMFEGENGEDNSVVI